MKKRIIILLVAAVVIIAIMATKHQRASRNGEIWISGSIEITDADLSFRIPGRVQARLVSEGESVKADQTVAKLDTSDLAQDVAIRKAEVAAVSALLAELEAGSRPEEISQAQAMLRFRQAERAL